MFDSIVWFLASHLHTLEGNVFKKIKLKFSLLHSPLEMDSFLKDNKIPRLSYKAQIALLKWSSGDWPLLLLNRIPSPQEMLYVQAQGKRFISFMPHLKGNVLGKKNSWTFMLHDLMHAERFFFSPVLYSAQVGFFKWLWHQHLNLSGPQWDYLCSDMNTHPVHSLMYLKHILQTANRQVELRIPHWHLINRQKICQEKYEDIRHFFEEYSKISLVPG